MVRALSAHLRTANLLLNNVVKRKKTAGISPPFLFYSFILLKTTLSFRFRLG
jgi:hypothetical protein